MERGDPMAKGKMAPKFGKGKKFGTESKSEEKAESKMEKGSKKKGY